MSQKVVVAEYYPPMVFFKIPKDVDLEDETKVEYWYVRYKTLYIKFVDKEELQEVEKEKVEEPDYKRPAKTSIEYAEEFLSDDEDEEDEKIIPSQIAIDAAQQYGGDPLDYCDICGQDRGDHDVSKRNYLIPCESDGDEDQTATPPA